MADEEEAQTPQVLWMSVKVCSHRPRFRFSTWRLVSQWLSYSIYNIRVNKTKGFRKSRAK